MMLFTFSSTLIPFLPFFAGKGGRIVS
jgi:hypothetical protein